MLFPISVAVLSYGCLRFKKICSSYIPLKILYENPKLIIPKSFLLTISPVIRSNPQFVTPQIFNHGSNFWSLIEYAFHTHVIALLSYCNYLYSFYTLFVNKKTVFVKINIWLSFLPKTVLDPFRAPWSTTSWRVRWAMACSDDDPPSPS